MLIETGIFSGNPRVDETWRNFFKLNRRAVFAEIAAEQLAIGRIDFRRKRQAGVFDVLHIGRVAKQPQKVKFDGAEKDNQKINGYKGVT